MVKFCGIGLWIGVLWSEKVLAGSARRKGCSIL